MKPSHKVRRTIQQQIELTLGEFNEKNRISPRLTYSQLWMQPSVDLRVNSFNRLWFNFPILDLAKKNVCPVQTCGDSSVALRPGAQNHQWHIQTDLCQAVNAILPVGFVLVRNVQTHGHALTCRRGNTLTLALYIEFAYVKDLVPGIDCARSGAIMQTIICW